MWRKSNWTGLPKNITNWRAAPSHVSRLRHHRSRMSFVRLQPSHREARDLRGRLFWKRKHRTDVDLAKHVAIPARCVARPKEKIGIPDHRQGPDVDPQQTHHLRRPLRFHFYPKFLELLRGCRMHDPRTRLGRRRVRTFRWRRDQRLDELVAETDNLVGSHVAADHAVG